MSVIVYTRKQVGQLHVRLCKRSVSRNVDMSPFIPQTIRICDRAAVRGRGKRQLPRFRLACGLRSYVLAGA